MVVLSVLWVAIEAPVTGHRLPWGDAGPGTWFPQLLGIGMGRTVGADDDFSHLVTGRGRERERETLLGS